MKKQAFLFVLLGALLVTGCQNGNQSSEPKKPEYEDLGVKDTHTALMKEYLADEWDSIVDYVPKVNAEDSSYHNDQSQPEPIKLEFAEVEDASKYYLQVAKDVEFKDYKLIEVESEEKAYNLYNTELGQDYYFRAAVSQEALEAAKIKKFKVTDVAPRYIHVDGVINFRDSGGWKTTLVPNGIVKQGLYYRCAKFDSITAEGKAEIQRLGIKVDIDMRDSYQVPTKSPASSDDWEVEVLKASVASGTENTRWAGTGGIAATYKKIFEAIAEADEKPIALHCTHGADRTGIVSWFLLGLLGVSKEDCGRDYVMTRFAGERAVLPTNEIKNWNEKTEALEGDTWAAKTYKHLNEDFGLETDTLETIREKFVPGYQRAA